MRVYLEIEAVDDEGFDDSVIRTVRENGTTLGFQSQGFEDSLAVGYGREFATRVRSCNRGIDWVFPLQGNESQFLNQSSRKPGVNRLAVRRTGDTRSDSVTSHAN